MADILKFTIPSGAPPKVVADFLRELADELEKQATAPNKAVVVLHTDLGEKFGVHSRFCNVTVVERTGLLHIALFDSLD